MIKLLSKYSHVNWAIADQAVVSGVNFLTGIILARYLGLVEFGLFTLAWMAVLFVNSFQFAMISIPMMSIGPQQNDHDAPAYFGAVLLQQAVFACLSFIVIFFGVNVTVIFFPEWGMQNFALPLASTAFFFQFQDFIRRYFFTRARPFSAFSSDVIRYGGQIIILLWLFQTSEMDAVGAIWVIAITSALAAVMSALFLGNISWDKNILYPTIQRHWKISKWITVSSILQWGSGHLFVLVTGAVLGVAAIGGMRAALNIMGIAHILFHGLDNVVPVRSAKHYQDGGKKHLTHYLRKVTWFCSLSTAILCLPLIIYPEILLKFIYGSEFSQYGYLMYWCVTIYLVMSLGLPLRAGLRAIESTKPIFYSYLWASSFTMLSAYPLAHYFNLNGIMFGTLIMHTGMIIVLTINFRWKLKNLI